MQRWGTCEEEHLPIKQTVSPFDLSRQRRAKPTHPSSHSSSHSAPHSSPPSSRPTTPLLPRAGHCRSPASAAVASTGRKPPVPRTGTVIHSHRSPPSAGARRLVRKPKAAGATQIWINLKEAKNAAEIVREVAVTELKMVETSTLVEDCTANVFWYERAISTSEVKLLNECQRVNMIPGMHEMARKSSLARALNRMRRLYPNDFDFFPATWNLPAQLDEFKREHAARAKAGSMPKTYIVKPSAGCQGAGIYLVNGPEELHPHTAAVVQEYLAAPALLDGYKFDFRLYVLVLSLRPVTVYLYREGMARFATNKYEAPNPANLKDVFMHLTNYSLNKNNADYVSADSVIAPGPPGLVAPLLHGSPSGGASGAKEAGATDSNAALHDQLPTGKDVSARGCSSQSGSAACGAFTFDATPRPAAAMAASDAEATAREASKRPVSEVLAALKSDGRASHDQIDGVWEQIKAIVSKTVIALHPFITSTYASCFHADASSGATAHALPKNCFQVIGFDLMLDAALRPWLIEVNHNPSFTCGTEFDRTLKAGVVRSALKLLRLAPFGKDRFRDQLDAFIAAKREKGATTPLERERLQQQRLQQQQRQKRACASASHRTRLPLALSASEAASAALGSSREGAAHSNSTSQHESEEPAPEEEGLFERALFVEEVGAHEHARFFLFSSTALQEAWRYCCGVRQRKLSQTRFQRFLREFSLLDEHLSAAEADQMYVQAITKTGVAFEDSSGMGYQEFCDVLIELAIKRYGGGESRAGDSVQKLIRSLGASANGAVSGDSPPAHSAARHSAARRPCTAEATR